MCRNAGVFVVVAIVFLILNVNVCVCSVPITVNAVFYYKYLKIFLPCPKRLSESSMDRDNRVICTRASGFAPKQR